MSVVWVAVGGVHVSTACFTKRLAFSWPFTARNESDAPNRLRIRKVSFLGRVIVHSVSDHVRQFVRLSATSSVSCHVPFTISRSLPSPAKAVKPVGGLRRLPY